MTENDDKPLTAFLAGNRQGIPGNGFVCRAMRRLPDCVYRISQVWITFCLTPALILFFAFDGLQQMLGTFREIFTTATQSRMTGLDPKSLLVTGIVLPYLFYREVCSLA